MSEERPSASVGTLRARFEQEGVGGLGRAFERALLQSSSTSFAKTDFPTTSASQTAHNVRIPPTRPAPPAPKSRLCQESLKKKDWDTSRPVRCSPAVSPRRSPAVSPIPPPTSRKPTFELNETDSRTTLNVSPPTDHDRLSAASIDSSTQSPRESSSALNKLPSRRPPIAPKPKFLPDYKPRFVEVPSERFMGSSDEMAETNAEASTLSPSADANVQPRLQKTDSIRSRVIQLQSLLMQGIAEKTNLPLPIHSRKISMGSTISAEEELSEDDMALSTEGEEEESEVPETKREDTRIFRRKNTISVISSSEAESAEMHENIMKELKRKDILRESRSMKGSSSNGTMADDIPSDVGKLRAADASQKSKRSALSPNSTISSYCSDRSSYSTTSSGLGSEVLTDLQPIYNTGNEEEDKRLRKLHHAAHEFLTVQTAFVKYLDNTIRVYPEYLVEYGKQTGRILLSQSVPPSGLHLSPPSAAGQESDGTHVVHQIQKLLTAYFALHSNIFLVDISEKISRWNSQEPDMSTVFIKSADFLKQCVPFLKEKARICDELTRLRQENKDFDTATRSFEINVFHRGVGAVEQQLDQVHQNFMRYKILMLRYSEYLKLDGEEKKRTDERPKPMASRNFVIGLFLTLKRCEVIAKLEKISTSVNVEMGLPTSAELQKLYDQFQFSDTLWLCRQANALGAQGLFDMRLSYDLPIEAVNVQAPAHSDYECYLQIKSKKKSYAVWFKKEESRREWMSLIQTAKKERKELLKRQQISKDGRWKHPRKDSGSHENGEEEREEETTTRPDCFPSSSIDTLENPSAVEDELTPVDTSNGNSSKARTMKDEKPVWITDNLSSECLMEGCENEFNFFRRRHHCRECGLLICKDCIGYAPVPRYDFARSIVCPQCYELFESKYLAGTLYPENRMFKDENGVYWIKNIVSRNGKSKKREHPGDRFTRPVNSQLKKMPHLEERLRDGEGVFSKVYWKNGKGAECERHALLCEDGNILKMFKARLDKRPAEVFIIYGFRVEEFDLSDGSGTLFQLKHANQKFPSFEIRSERAEDTITFRVRNEKSARMWSEALQQRRFSLAELKT